jgi:hypothetical protein
MSAPRVVTLVVLSCYTVRTCQTSGRVEYMLGTSTSVLGRVSIYNLEKISESGMYMPGVGVSFNILASCEINWS